MTFGPILSADAIAKAKALQLAPLADGLYIERVYGHWSVEQWGWNELGYYSFVLDKQNGVWVILASTPLTLNGGDYPLPFDYAAHTWKRNDHALGVAINALSSYPDGRGATPSDFGPHPLELDAVELMCALVARLCLAYTIDPTGVMPGDNARAGEPTFWTHAEAAIADKYFPGDGDVDARWDMARLAPSADPLSKTEAAATGSLLRGRIEAYYAALATGVVDR